jgi:hypothetical protein
MDTRNILAADHPYSNKTVKEKFELCVELQVHLIIQIPKR